MFKQVFSGKSSRGWGTGAREESSGLITEKRREAEAKKDIIKKFGEGIESFREARDYYSGKRSLRYGFISHKDEYLVKVADSLLAERIESEHWSEFAAGMSGN